MPFSVILLSVAFAFTALVTGWTPPEDPDPSAILQEAKQDTRNGDYERALAKHIWYHENAVKIDRSQTGVRLSFALSSWLELGEVYPPALAKMREYRDAAEKRIRDEEQVRVRFDDFHDFTALNRTLRDEKRTVVLFRWLAENDAEDAERMFVISRPALIEEEEYALCGQFIDAEEDLKRIRRSYKMALEFGDKFGDQYQEVVTNRLVSDVTTLVALLVLNEKQAEAKSVAEQSQEFIEDEALLNRLREKLPAALEGKVPDP